jgi:uncharacterized protein (TIGR02118 family)
MCFMIKLVLVLKRLGSKSHEEFMNDWLNLLVPIVARFPGLRKYLISPSTGERLTSRTVSAEYDGIAELYFDSLEAADRAFNSQEGQMSREVGRNFIGQAIYMIVSEQQIV